MTLIRPLTQPIYSTYSAEALYSYSDDNARNFDCDAIADAACKSRTLCKSNFPMTRVELGATSENSSELMPWSAAPLICKQAYWRCDKPRSFESTVAHYLQSSPRILKPNYPSQGATTAVPFPAPTVTQAPLLTTVVLRAPMSERESKEHRELKCATQRYV